jgi:hypothetical protein
MAGEFAELFLGLGVDTKMLFYKVCRLMCQMGFGQLVAK